MAPRKNTKKQPKPTARARKQTVERTPSPPKSADLELAYRPLKTVNELRNVMGDESDDQTTTGSVMESYRDSTTQSRPNFSFLPSHKHSSPNNHGNKRTATAAAAADQPPATVHRLTSMSTVPNTGLEHEDTESEPGPSTSRRGSSRSERDETGGSSISAAANTGRNSTKGKPSRNRKQKIPTNLNVLKEIHRLQGTVHNLIPKLSFGRLIREVLSEYSHRSLKVTPQMLECLQESAEVYLMQVFSDSYRCTLHRGRVTLIPKDMELALMLRRN